MATVDVLLVCLLLDFTRYDLIFFFFSCLYLLLSASWRYQTVCVWNDVRIYFTPNFLIVVFEEGGFFIIIIILRAYVCAGEHRCANLDFESPGWLT